MTDEHLWKVRLLIAEARATSANRHLDFMTAYGNLMTELRDFWYSVAPEGTALPPELVEKINQFGERWK